MGQFFLTASKGQPSFICQPAVAAEITTFWRQSSRYWFAKNPAFDEFFRRHFIHVFAEILQQRHDDWLADPNGALALILMTDQFPRSAFRGTRRMYAADARAISYARIALKAGYPNQVEERLKLFFYLPFSHSEELADQLISVAFNERLGQPWAAEARGYMEIISRFGRFPHRNAMLGRDSTQEEVAFLQALPQGGRPIPAADSYLG